MYKNRSRGFTLIELLVVIAIIGILSAVVLASLSTARNKGNDAAVQSDLAAIQSQAEIFYGSTGGNTYGTANAVAGGSCTATAGSLFTDATIVKATTGAATAGSGTVVCNNSTSAYAVSSPLQAGVGGKMFWCVDSTGTAKPEAAALTALTALSCP
jgi:prepilin-type N-terminal cleavage/methylation domain-containing protein